MTRHVNPTEVRPARMNALARLPMFLELHGRRAVVAGADEEAAWKIELLAAAGADVLVVAPVLSVAVAELFGTPGLALTHCDREWNADDLEGAAVAVGSFDSEREAAAFAAAARRRKVPVNVIDKPMFCDFQFGAIVNRSPVVVAVSTDGVAPVLGQAIRRRLEAMLPKALGPIGIAARAFRERLPHILPDRNDRRRFWESFAERALSSTGGADAGWLEPLATDLAARRTEAGQVFLVGAGPGDPELLTMKALRILQTADVILYDRLVSPEILELARREARRIEVGKKGHGPTCKQDDINALIVREALAGHRVVRLKGGDPAVFGRVGEEAAACTAAGLSVEIVPGITTASALAARFGIGLTHRDHSNRVQYITGHDRGGRLPADLHFAALADRRATTVVYMPLKTIGELASRLIAEGAAADTPVLLARDVSRPAEDFVATTLDGVLRSPPADDGRPTIALIGSVVQSRADALAAAAELVAGA
jgi:uroporphyrin-III C-methyltransferase / precorrin-2 dehydrogenase / sirohydrochlorin ferrochelatase